MQVKTWSLQGCDCVSGLGKRNTAQGVSQQVLLTHQSMPFGRHDALCGLDGHGGPQAAASGGQLELHGGVPEVGQHQRVVHGLPDAGGGEGDGARGQLDAGGELGVAVEEGVAGRLRGRQNSRGRERVRVIDVLVRAPKR